MAKKATDREVDCRVNSVYNLLINCHSKTQVVPYAKVMGSQIKARSRTHQSKIESRLFKLFYVTAKENQGWRLAPVAEP